MAVEVHWQVARSTLEDGEIFYEPARDNSAVPPELVEERGVMTGATLSTRGDMPYRGRGRALEVPAGEAGNPSSLAAADFIDCIRNDRATFADERVGRASAVAVALGNRAVRGLNHVDFADHLEDAP